MPPLDKFVAAPKLNLERFLADPPSFTRIEPVSTGGNPSPGLEARVHDPLWLLLRQWQLGEFHGEDAGSPISVEVATSTAQLVAWQPGDPADKRKPKQLDPDVLLEALVEREPTDPKRPPGIRARAEAGAHLVELLTEANLAAIAAQITVRAPLAAAPTSPDEPADRVAERLLSILAGRVPDAELACKELGIGSGGMIKALPAWLKPAGKAKAALQVIVDWAHWYRTVVAPPPDADTDTWIDDRLEHRFSLLARQAGGDVVLSAPAYDGGSLDWYAVDHDSATAFPLKAPKPGVKPEQRKQSVLATPLRFAGMPADRLWEFEDAQINLGALEAQPHDLPRLLLVEFATAFSNDWLVVPVDASYGTLVDVESVTYRTTFGEQFSVKATAEYEPHDPWQMFTSSPAQVGALPQGEPPRGRAGLFIAPAARGTLEGPPLEEVLYLRDEMANLAWAVERVVEGASGDPMRRGEGGGPTLRPPDMAVEADLDYLLETQVPAQWIPFLPVSTGLATFELRRGAMLRFDANGDSQPIEPLGRLLSPPHLSLRDEEVPRRGVRVARVPSLARRFDGRYVRWISRSVGVGRGEGSSGLAFDSARPHTRPANEPSQ